MKDSQRKTVPVITVGRYAGTPIDKLPNSYLRWMITQDFSEEILEAVKSKLEDSEYNDLYLSISRHAIDMFSKRFLWRWVNARDEGETNDGLATFMAKLAQEAWDKGTDISKFRHRDDGIVKNWDGIKWVFGVNPNYPDYRDVITVMSDTEE